MTDVQDTPTQTVRQITATSRRAKGTARKVLLGTTGIVGLLIAWQLVPILGLAPEQFFPPATTVLAAFVTMLGEASFWDAVGITMYTWLIGLTVAVVSASVLGLIIGSSTFLRRATRSTIEFLRPIPSVALIPLAVLLFGVRIGGVLILVIYACFWQVLVQVLYGVADVDSVARSTTRVYGLGFVARVRHLVIPTVMPYLMTGVRLAATVALVITITAQMVIGSPGLGSQIVVAQSSANVPRLFALVVAAGLIGVIVNLIARRVERPVLHWHTSVRSEAPR